VSSERLLGHTAPDAVSSYTLLLTADPDIVRAAQRLRRRVMAEEFGLPPELGRPDIDADRFDRFCDHLVVRENATQEIVGTYRLLPPDAARAAGGLYSESEFDCSALDSIRSRLVETGRSCVASEHRSGAVVGMVWSGILRYLKLTGNRWLVGCASVPVGDGGTLAAGVWNRVSTRHACPPEFRMSPLRPWTPDRQLAVTQVLLPPLLRGYLRLGAWVCGAPADDPEFACADFPVLLDVHRMDARYARHFLGGDG
jgi:putative hemolysin